MISRKKSFFAAVGRCALTLCILLMLCLFTGCKKGQNGQKVPGQTNFTEKPAQNGANQPTEPKRTLFTDEDIARKREEFKSEGYVETGRKSTGYSLSRESNALQNPGTRAESFDELLKIVDYNSFYEIPEFSVTLAYSHNFKSAETLANEIYWNASLITEYCAVFAEFDETDANVVHISLRFYDYGVLCAPEGAKKTKILGYGNAPKAPRGEDFDDFAYQKSQKTLAVYNSKQLWYGLENGYNVVPVENSPAEECLEAAKAILRAVCSDDMTDEEKALNIFIYGAENIVYDTASEDNAASLPSYSETGKYPDKSSQTFAESDVSASMFDSFFLDGALLSSHAVCQGQAQYLDVLLSMEGIECHRYTARSLRFGDTRNVFCVDGTYYVHGFDYVKLDGEYRICDLTYTYAGVRQNGYGQNQTLFRDLGYMLSKETHRGVYGDFMLVYSDKYEAKSDIDYYSYPQEYDGGTVCAVIDSAAAAKKYAEFLSSEISRRDDIAVGDFAAFEARFTSDTYASVFIAELERSCIYYFQPLSNIGYIFKSA